MSVLGYVLTVLLCILPGFMLLLRCRRLERENEELRDAAQDWAMAVAFRQQTDLLPGETPAKQPRGMWG